MPGICRAGLCALPQHSAEMASTSQLMIEKSPPRNRNLREADMQDSVHRDYANFRIGSSTPARSWLSVASKLRAALPCCEAWRTRRIHEARVRYLESLLREMDPRLREDLGFELMGRKASDPHVQCSNALIQAVKTVCEAYSQESQ